MRDDGSLDDQYGLDGSVDRSDDTPSTDQLTACAEASTSRGFLRTRFNALVNPLAARPGRSKMAMATGAVCCLGLVGGFTQIGARPAGDPPNPAASA
ncbi:hypothetical protein F8274_12540, partial [Micromonospora sp. AMSO31t]